MSISYQKRRTRRGLIAEINLVPYIDVILVLLVIFMITAPLMNQGVKVQLPQASAQNLPDKQTPIIVSVDAQGRYYLNVSPKPNLPIDAATLLSQVAAQLQLAAQNHQDRPVLVKGDTDVAYGKVMNAMVLLQQAGVPSVGLMTQPQQGQG